MLYVVKLKNGDTENGKRLNSIYYTMVNDKIYIANSSGGFHKRGVKASEMIDYTKSHGEVDRVMNVAKRTSIIDMSNTSSTASEG